MMKNKIDKTDSNSTNALNRIFVNQYIYNA